MRKLKQVHRCVLVAIVVTLLSVPVHARSNNEERVTSGLVCEQIAKVVKIVNKVKCLIRTFGDGLIDPRP